MSQTPFLLEHGALSQVLGSVSSLAMAAPLVDGTRDPAALTDPNRIGYYYDRTAGLEKLGVVVMGHETLGIFSDHATVTGDLNVTGTLNLPAQVTAKFMAGPATGSPAAPTFRSIVATDLPSFGTSAAGIVPASGGGTSNFLRADGTWASPPVSSGTVTSVGLSSSTLSVSGSPITSSGSITVDLPAVISAGSVGSSSIVPVITFDNKGRLTAVTTASITPGSIGAYPASSVVLNVGQVAFGGGSNTVTGTAGFTFGGGLLTLPGDGSAAGSFISTYTGALGGLHATPTAGASVFAHIGTTGGGGVAGTTAIIGDTSGGGLAIFTGPSSVRVGYFDVNDSVIGVISIICNGCVIAGVQTAVAAVSGQVGEVIFAAVTSYTGFSVFNAAQDLTHLDLTAGDWHVTATVTYFSAGAVTSNSTQFGISRVSASVAPDSPYNIDGSSLVQIPVGVYSTLAVYHSVTVEMDILVGFSQTIYLCAYNTTYSTLIPQYVCSMSARRMR